MSTTNPTGMPQPRQALGDMYAVTPTRLGDIYSPPGEPRTLMDVRWGHQKEVTDVLHERLRQNNKFGAGRHHTPMQWLSILMEEVGEVATEVIDFAFGVNPADEAYVALRDRYYDELKQVAAVALAAMQNINQNRRAENFLNS